MPKRGRRARRLVSPERRQERWRICAGYIRRTESLDEARALAKTEHQSFDTSVWLSALGKILEGKI